MPLSFSNGVLFPLLEDDALGDNERYFGAGVCGTDQPEFPSAWAARSRILQPENARLSQRCGRWIDVTPLSDTPQARLCVSGVLRRVDLPANASRRCGLLHIQYGDLITDGSMHVSDNFAGENVVCTNPVVPLLLPGGMLQQDHSSVVDAQELTLRALRAWPVRARPTNCSREWRMRLRSVEGSSIVRNQLAALNRLEKRIS